MVEGNTVIPIKERQGRVAAEQQAAALGEKLEAAKVETAKKYHCQPDWQARGDAGSDPEASRGTERCPAGRGKNWRGRGRAARQRQAGNQAAEGVIERMIVFRRFVFM